jgi:serine/threonine protein phosphatase PrpC
VFRRSSSVAIELFRQLLTETRYDVRFHDDKWIECFVSNGLERWHGRGSDQTEALEDVLRQMMPSALARNLLEHRAPPPAPAEPPPAEPPPAEPEAAEPPPAEPEAAEPEVVEPEAAEPEVAEVAPPVEVVVVAPPVEVAEVVEVAPPVEVAEVVEVAPPAEVAEVVEVAPPAAVAEVAEVAPPAEVAEVAPPVEVAEVVEVAPPAEVVEVALPADADPTIEVADVDLATEAAEVAPPAEVVEAPAADVAPATDASPETAPVSVPTASRPAGRSARVLSAVRTDPGLVQPQNQDASAMVQERGLFMVAAGVGAGPRGGVASAMAMDMVRERIEGEPAPATLRGKALPALVAAIQHANTVIYAAGRRDPALRGMGATFAAVLAMGRAAGLAHVGDSRIYRLRRDVLELLTTDHSPVNQRLQAGAASAPRRAATRALGTHRAVEVETAVVTGQPGDVLLLCTPGLPRVAGTEEIAGILRDTESPETAAEELVARALAHGGPENVTALVIRWER